MVDYTDCPWCRAKGSISEREDVETFPLRDGRQVVLLSCQVPVISCAECHEQWTDHRGEDARTSAIEAHLEALRETWS